MASIPCSAHQARNIHQRLDKQSQRQRAVGQQHSPAQAIPGRSASLDEATPPSSPPAGGYKVSEYLPNVSKFVSSMGQYLHWQNTRAGHSTSPPQAAATGTNSVLSCSPSDSGVAYFPVGNLSQLSTADETR